jgi:hypothetical protein
MRRHVKFLLITTTTAAAVGLGGPAVAQAAPPTSVPNSSASNNCIATSSGLLFSQQSDGLKLGQDVRQFAPHGGQASFIQGQQTSCGGRSR